MPDIVPKLRFFVEIVANIVNVGKIISPIASMIYIFDISLKNFQNYCSFKCQLSGLQ